MPPSVNLSGADAVLARDLRGCQLRPKALADDLALLFQRPRSSALPRQHLHASFTSAHTIGRTSALNVADQIPGNRVHPELGSRQAHQPPEVVAATLTLERRGAVVHHPARAHRSRSPAG